MNKNQIKVFWSMFIGFCGSATSILYYEGALHDIDRGAAAILTIIYLICSLPIYLYVKNRKDKFESWFN